MQNRLVRLEEREERVDVAGVRGRDHVAHARHRRERGPHGGAGVLRDAAGRRLRVDGVGRRPRFTMEELEGRDRLRLSRVDLEREAIHRLGRLAAVGGVSGGRARDPGVGGERVPERVAMADLERGAVGGGQAIGAIRDRRESRVRAEEGAGGGREGRVVPELQPGVERAREVGRDRDALVCRDAGCAAGVARAVRVGGCHRRRRDVGRHEPAVARLVEGERHQAVGVRGFDGRKHVADARHPRQPAAQRDRQGRRLGGTGGRRRGRRDRSRGGRRDGGGGSGRRPGAAVGEGDREHRDGHQRQPAPSGDRLHALRHDAAGAQGRSGGASRMHSRTRRGTPAIAIGSVACGATRPAVTGIEATRRRGTSAMVATRICTSPGATTPTVSDSRRVVIPQRIWDRQPRDGCGPQPPARRERSALARHTATPSASDATTAHSAAIANTATAPAGMAPRVAPEDGATFVSQDVNTAGNV